LWGGGGGEVGREQKKDKYFIQKSAFFLDIVLLLLIANNLIVKIYENTIFSRFVFGASPLGSGAKRFAQNTCDDS
jgi:hypothetical protein